MDGTVFVLTYPLVIFIIFNCYYIIVPGQLTKVIWHSKQGTGLAMEALTGEGVIYIKKSGYYFVSSLLTMQAQNIPTTDSYKHLPYIMSHVVYVVRHKDKNEQLLLENVKSMCALAFESAERSSNIGAVFHLDEHDKVYMATSHPYNLVSGHSSNYLSIHTIL